MLNKVGFTLSELSICSEPLEYELKFTSEDSEDIQYTLVRIPANLSQRLQIFEITEGVDVTFEVEGYYSYEIRQTTSGNLVEVGLLRVEGENAVEQVITTATNPQVYGK